MVTTLLVSIMLAMQGQSAVNLREWPQAADDPNAPVFQAFPERVRMTAPRPMKPPQPILAHDLAAFDDVFNVHHFGPVVVAEVSATDATLVTGTGAAQPRRMGVIRLMQPASLALNEATASMRFLDDGHILWFLAVRSPGAQALRLHITRFELSDGYMVTYNHHPAEGLIVRGPFTGRGPDRDGDFWTASLPGDTAYVEVVSRVPPQFEVKEVFHREILEGGECPNNQPGPCHLNVMCYTVDPVARDAVGDINAVAGCTGTILMDEDPDTDMPYFITALHCGIDTPAEADMIEVVWFWQMDQCSGAVPPYFSLPRSVGGTLLHANSDNDMTFVRLDDPLEPGVGMAGWTTSTSVDGYGIHHPCRSWKRVTFFSPVGACPFDCACADPNDFDYYDVDPNGGFTEDHSSGSGIFNSQGQLAGQLWGKCCACTDPVDCSHINDFTYVYGEFQTSYPIMRRWLDIGGTINVNRAYSGTELGTPPQPFNTVAEGYNLAWDRSRIRIQANTYPEAITMNKAIVLLASGGVVRIGQ